MVILYYDKKKCQYFYNKKDGKIPSLINNGRQYRQ